ncbi:hypothetical protein QQZ08_010199 [Neonectria magnoliae]|uniref:F-box domain-containing protein n=1 Tax=Neonectria magnoliae TaxID=2732573 RepID=A0ABR1HI47_9HYPO
MARRRTVPLSAAPSLSAALSLPGTTALFSLTKPPAPSGSPQLSVDDPSKRLHNIRPGSSTMSRLFTVPPEITAHITSFLHGKDLED